MSDTPYVHSLFYAMKKPQFHDETFTVTETNAVTLQIPQTVAYPIGLSDFLLSPATIRTLDNYADTPNFYVQIVPVFAYKFELNVLDFDSKAVDAWFDGIPRIRGGTVSLLNSFTFIDLFTISHEEQVERASKTHKAIVGDLNSNIFAGFIAIAKLEDEVHFAGLCPTAFAYRLTKTVILEVKIWWLYRFTIFSYFV